MRFACIAAGLATIFVATSASAQLAVATGFPTRQGVSHGSFAGGGGIDRDDCVRPFETWSFAFTLPSGVAFDDLELWARAGSGSCAESSARSGASRSCFHVATFLSSAVTGAQVVSTSSLAILGAVVTKSDVVDATKVDLDAACFPTTDETPQPITLDFLLFSGGNAIAGQEASFATSYDRGMPAPPPNVVASVQPSQDVLVSWDALLPATSDVVAFNVYCEDVTQFDAGCIWPDTAKHGAFVAPELDVAPCGTAAPSANSAVVQDLARNHTYAFVVASIDAAGNSGPISAVVCASPQGNLVPAGSADVPQSSDASGCACRTTPRAGDAYMAYASLLAAFAVYARKRRR